MSAEESAAREALERELLTALEAAEAFGRPLAIEALGRLPVGASQELWTFTLRHGQGAAPLVLRRPPADAEGASEISGLDAGRENEVVLQATLAERGVRTPRVYARLAEDRASGRRGGFVMDRLSGATDPNTLLRDPAYAPCREVLLGQLAEAIAAVHATPLEVLPPLQTQGPAAQRALFGSVVDRFDVANPGFEWALRWLEAHEPPERAPRLAHGDFRMSNFMADEAGLTGLIDWELAHLGDPVEDLGWICLRSWRFARPDRPAAGLGSRAALVAAYEAAGGAPVEPERLRFWEALAAVKWAAICLVQNARHFAPEGGARGGIENAGIGRRFDEAMHDFFGVVDDWSL